MSRPGRLGASVASTVSRVAGLLLVALGARVILRIASFLEGPIEVDVLGALVIGALAAVGALTGRRRVDRPVQLVEAAVVVLLAGVALIGALGPPYPAFGPLRYDPVYSPIVIGVWLAVVLRAVRRG